MAKPLVYRDGEPFPGRAATLAESVPAWPVPARAPAGAPNVVLVVLDDVGFAQIGCFGSDIATPRFDRLAAEGLRYRNFHTTAMCSPTRACLLTGRNHHTCAMGGRFGGFSLYVHAGRLHYTANFAGIERTTVSSPQPLAPGRHVVGVGLEPASGNGLRVELVVGGDVVAVGEAPRTAPFRFALAGEGLCCGYDDGTPVADVYESPYAFTGTIHEAVIDVSARRCSIWWPSCGGRG